jgi:hypothetical protein
MKKLLALPLLVIFLGCLSAQDVLTNDSVAKLVKAGLSEEIILNMVKTQPAKFDTGADQIVALKSANVSDKIINAMVLRGDKQRPTLAAGSSGVIKIQNRTPVKLVMVKTLSSGTAKSGEAFSLVVDEDVLVSGKVAIAKGATASGRVTAVRAKNLTSRNGLLEITIDSAKSVDEQDVPLRATINKDGGGTGFGKMGKNVEIPQGFLINAVVDADREIKLPEQK